jgi:glutamyl-tRNA reductase
LFVVCGLNQQTPLAYREQIAFHHTLACQLQGLPGILECVALSTCNRTEIYAYVSDLDSLQNWWKNHHLQIWPQIESYFYCYTGDDALRHAISVACGLDSMLIGEPQILGQLKIAYQQALDYRTVGTHLQPCFNYIFHVTKKIRNQSGISKHPISVASVAVDCIQQHFDNVSDKKALIIGSGDTARLAAIHLQEKGCHQFFVTSRHIEHAQKLAQELQGDAFVVTELQDHLHEVDIVVTATSCPLPFISRQTMEHTLAQRKQSPMVLIDLAVPRDIEPDVATLSNIVLINIDHLQQIQAHHQAERLRAAEIAKAMVEDAIIQFHKKHRTLKAQHMICHYRDLMKDIAQSEVQRAHQKLEAGHCQFQVVNELSERLIQKLMHYPTVGMQQAASDERHDILELAQYLFHHPQS